MTAPVLAEHRDEFSALAGYAGHRNILQKRAQGDR